ncbi:hypothetical protein BBP40_011546 [Aspergillus hancockii]|nr:hypothetical protein BBP40_011546 [Aspergillus hancockii]
MKMLMDEFMPGRWANMRPGTRAEVEWSTILRIDIDTSKSHVRTRHSFGTEEENDLEAGAGEKHWEGAIPIWGTLHVPIPGLNNKISFPERVTPFVDTLHLNTFVMYHLLLGLLGAAATISWAAPAQGTASVGNARTSSPPGCLSVGASAQYHTVGAALSALGSSSSPACVYIARGLYKEQIVVNYKGPLTLYGETSDTGTYKGNGVTITHAISSDAAGTLDDSATLRVRSANFKMYNINVANGFGQGKQAVALAADANHLGFYGCQFHGFQDTVFTKSGTQFYSKCLIEGAVDYIFGGASAWFDRCDIRSNGAGYITASAREAQDNTWLAFDHCNIIGAGGMDLRGKVYLGRPWRTLARVIYQNSALTDVVAPKGWSPMAKGATPLFYEVRNTGAGSNVAQREFLRPIASVVTREQVLGNDVASWVDSRY